jgi:hypothetical protein
MSEKEQVRLSDYVNRPRRESDKNLLQQQLNESLRTETDVQVAEETLAALGGSEKISRFTVPQPTMGVFPLLEIIDSPFLRPGSPEITLREVYETLYVIMYKQKAVTGIYRAFRADNRLKSVQAIAEKSPDFYYVYLRALAEFADRRAEFDIEVAKFADELGVFDMLEAIRIVNSFLNASSGGFSMLPDDAKESDKKKDLTLNGLRQTSQS